MCVCDTVVPSARVLAVKGKELQHDLEGFVAPTAGVIGDVTMGNTGSVWYSAVVRGEPTFSPYTTPQSQASHTLVFTRCLALSLVNVVDNTTGDKNPVTIGRGSAIGDRATVDGSKGPVTIGADVTIGTHSHTHTHSNNTVFVWSPRCLIIAAHQLAFPPHYTLLRCQRASRILHN